MISFKTFYFILLLFSICNGDIYMHNPRGSNNRLNEKNANRNNANRLFDSQNNNKGGYNVGDAGENPARNEAGQYQMKFYGSSDQAESKLQISWTNQHGCGDTNGKLNCNQVLQFMCQPSSVRDTLNKMRDGTNTGTVNENGQSRSQGLHEGKQWYDKCKTRERNKGLFTADQNLNGNSAKHTRQNPGGTRRGLECPEERDYHPYWHPSPWGDIAVLAEDDSRCDFYKSESFNSKPKGECRSTNGRNNEKYNNKEACVNNGKQWRELHSYLEIDESVTSPGACASKSRGKLKYVWGFPADDFRYNYQEKCMLKLPPPDCRAADFSRVNHLGNSDTLEPLSYVWNLPYFPSGNEQRCVFRIRYNISTGDYNPLTANSNNNNGNTDEPLIENDPEVDIGGKSNLQLAINTAQFGRTFQDRSHIFIIKSRKEAGIPDNVVLHNLNVQGKRGNIVQTFPAVEYDFYPFGLAISEDDYVHIQWTGSNTHDNNGNGNDGQAGDDGEGKGGSDRSNILCLLDPNSNFPADSAHKDCIFNNIDKIVPTTGVNYDSKDIAIQMASSGYFLCRDSSKCGANSLERKNKMQNQLNNAPASYPGAVLKIKAGVYHFVCTRNNNFTNRSQKGKLTVNASKKKK